MAKIPLRAYIKEIENLIERGEIEPAVAHAKNILRAYPKSIETYRLLGKAYLESQRYSEASDILQRVLSVIPDDFVSQIGMSIIREDEGNMDAAIWHMERAYEVQPFNPAVQDELRRLYGRRDGIEPPKIRLTRGALVRMYLRGELYPQAIAETRAALAEDPQRYDLRVLLAKLYYETGQKNDAAEVCSELIAKLPYCYEANRLLAEILPTTSRAEETPKFQQRIYALNPYEAFVSPSAPTSAQVPDQAVMVEQTIWEPDAEVEQSPDWARTVGATWEEAEPEEVLPEWLSTLKPESAAPETTAPAPPMPDESAFAGLDDSAGSSGVASEGESEDLVPDWMKEAGWAPSDRTADEIMAEQAASGDEDEIQPAEIPDWLQSMAPAETDSPAGVESERDEWLDNILLTPAAAAEEAPAEPMLTAEDAVAGAVADAVAGAGEEAGSEPTTADESEPQDWLAGLENKEQQAESADLPDWLAEMQQEQTQETISSLPESLSGEGGAPDLDQFTESEEAAPVEASEDVPDWLKSFEMDEGEETGEPQTEISEVDGTAEGIIPEGLQAEETSGMISAEGDAVEAGELPDWLQSLQGETGLAEEEISTTLDMDKDRGGFMDEPLPPAEAAAVDMPEFEEEAVGPAVLETAETAAEPMEETPAVVEGALEAAPDFSDTDATMAWLEALAARQGADEETLITPPDQRTEELPDWLQKETQATEETTEGFAAIYDLTEGIPDAISAEMDSPVESMETEEETAATVETLLEEPPVTIETGTSEPAAVPDEEMSLREWLASQEETSIEGVASSTAEETERSVVESIESETAETLIVAGENLFEQPTDLRGETETTDEAQVEPAAEESAMPDLSNMDDAMAWLESLAARQGADEATLITPVDQRTETPPDWVSEIKEEESVQEAEAVQIGQDIDAAASDVTAEAEEELPDWLKDTAAWPTQQEDETGITVEELVNFEEENQPTTPIAQRDGTIEEPSAQEEIEEAGALDWLKDIESEPISTISTDAPIQWTDDVEVEGALESEVPTWLAEETNEPAAQEQTAGAESEGLPDWLAGLKDESETPAAETAAPVSVDYHTAWGPELTSDDLPDEESTAEPTEAPAALQELQKSLNQGELETALEGYNRLIQNDEHLEDVIRDLRDALYRYPVDVNLWQTLGDAYAHSDQLQDALDAYTKAEELLR